MFYMTYVHVTQNIKNDMLAYEFLQGTPFTM